MKYSGYNTGEMAELAEGALSLRQREREGRYHIGIGLYVFLIPETRNDATT
jgi:hypothetical protein